MTRDVMRAFVLRGPGDGGVEEVPVPRAAPGEVVVDVDRVGVCGTDSDFFHGEMAYLDQGVATFPMRLGHEWCGRVSAIGDAVDPGWLGTRVMGDTMIGDGTCRRCVRGHQHVCRSLQEVGIRDGRPGALAEKIAVPVRSLRTLPDEVDAVLGAMVEPGGNAWRAAQATGAGPDDRVLVIGPGTIGLLTGMFLRAAGAEVHLLGRRESSLAFARDTGFENAWLEDSLPDLPFDAVVDASNSVHAPGVALDLVESAGRVVFIGLAGSTSAIDTRAAVLKDVTAIGVLSGSPGLEATIAAYASREVDPRPLVAATVGLDDVASVLAGGVPDGAGSGPKIHIDPRLG